MTFRGLATTFAVTLVIAVFGLPSASAQVGRDFAGEYALRDVVENALDLMVALTVEITNYSGAAVSSALVTPEDPLHPDTDYGSYTPSTSPTGATFDSPAPSSCRLRGTPGGNRDARRASPAGTPFAGSFAYDTAQPDQEAQPEPRHI